MRRILTAVILCLVSLPAILSASPASFSFDFSRQTLSAWGLAGIPWEDTLSFEEERSRAWMDALHHGYEAVLETPLMEGVTVRNALQANPALKERLGQLLLSSAKTFFKVDETGLVRCRIDIPFSGPMSLRSAFYLAALRPVQVEPAGFGASGTFLATLSPKDGSVPGGAKPANRPDGDALASLAEKPGDSDSERNEITGLPGKYLRLVLDLRRSTFEPSLFPRFFSEDGHFLFQESRIPGPKRFSRPIVRFTQNLSETEDGLQSSEVMYVSAYAPVVSRRDIKIAAPDSEIFYRFCKRLELEPESRGEILIVYGDVLFPGGLLPKVASKEKEKAPKKPSVAKPQKKRR